MSEALFSDVEVLSLIQQTAIKAEGADNKIHIVKVENGERRPLILAVKPDATFDVISDRLEPPARETTLQSVSQVSDYLEFVEDKLGLPTPTVWISDSCVHVVLFDAPDSDRMDHATVEFRQTAAFEFLSGQATASQPTQFGHKDFLQLLRRRLSDCLPPDSTILDVLKRISFSKSKRGQSEVGTDRSSYGLEIDSKLTSELGAIPETITLAVRLYEDPALLLRRDIKCAIEADAETCTFAIYPLASEIQDAEAEERAHIRDVMSLDVPVFDGTP